MADNYMNKSELVVLRGTALFATFNGLDKYGKQSCAIYPDQESMAKVHKLISEGVKNQIKKDDDGKYRVVFSRPPKIKTKTKGEVDLEPAKITDSKGNDIQSRQVPDGADITMTLETYGGRSPGGYGTYKAARLLSVKIN